MNLTKRLEAIEAAAAKQCSESETLMVGMYETDAEALARHGLSEFPKGTDVFRWPDSTRCAFAAIKAGAPLDEIRAGKWQRELYACN